MALLEKIQSAEKRLRMRQIAVEALQSGPGQAARGSLSTTGAGGGAHGLTLAGASGLVRSEKGRKTIMEALYSREAIRSNGRSPCELRWRSSGCGWPQSRPQLWTPTATRCTERGRTRLTACSPNASSTVRPMRSNSQPRTSCFCARRARKRDGEHRERQWTPGEA